MRLIPVSHLKGGEILAVNIINANMLVLIHEGSILTLKLIDRIRKYGILTVYIRDPEMEKYLKDKFDKTINEIVRNKSVNGIKTGFERFEIRLKKEKRRMRYSDSGSELFHKIKRISNDLISEVLRSKNLKVSMIDIKSASDYHYEHSVSVAVLSLVIGTELRLSIKELENLAYGALLIDIGCNWIDKELLFSSSKLSDYEMKNLREHVELGYNYITTGTIFNAHIKSIIMHHHERIDGSGYPNGLTEKEIHPLAKIVMIADVYDAMTSDRPYRAAYNQSEAFEYIMANAGTLFDFEIASIFAQKVVPYPVGTYVKLSNNQKGVVIQNNDFHPLRPIVRTFGKSKYTSKSSFMIDLLETNNVTIDKVVYDLKQ